METLHISLFSVVEDLAHDWLYLQRDKHSRHILGVHSFVSLTVRLSKNCVGTCSSDWPFKGLNIIVIWLDFHSTK